MTKSKKLWVMIVLGFVLGFIITISEPDLQVLAEQVPSVPNMVLVVAVAVGVGIFLVVALMRILFAIPLPPLLVVFYAIVFLLAVFTPKSFLSVAFDSGGVTTGPMTVPFIMALGIGISAIRSDRHAADDSFGLVALCSIGPILAVLLLGMIFQSDGGHYAASTITEVADSVELGYLFLHALPDYLREIAVSLLPIILFFAAFPDFITETEEEKSDQDCNWSFVYLYWSGAVSDGSQCGIYACGKLSGSGDCEAALPLDYSSHRHVDRIFYCHGGTSGLRIDEAGGRADRRNHLGCVDQDRTLHQCGSVCGTCHVPRADWNFHFLSSDPRIWGSNSSILLCAKDFYRNCV